MTLKIGNIIKMGNLNVGDIIEFQPTDVLALNEKDLVIGVVLHNTNKTMIKIKYLYATPNVINKFSKVINYIDTWDLSKDNSISAYNIIIHTLKKFKYKNTYVDLFI